MGEVVFRLAHSPAKRIRRDLGEGLPWRMGRFIESVAFLDVPDQPSAHDPSETLPGLIRHCSSGSSTAFDQEARSFKHQEYVGAAPLSVKAAISLITVAGRYILRR